MGPGGGPPGPGFPYAPPHHQPHPPPPQARPLWTEHRGKDGRTYWYNRDTRKSSWEKPEELGGVGGGGSGGPGGAGAPSTSLSTPWREVKAPDGRPYFHNRETKESVWACPTELAAAREAAAAAAAAAAVAAAAAAAAAAGRGGGGGARPTAGAAPALPGAADAAARAAAAAKDGKFMYATKAEAKAAFCELLAAAGARSDDAWERVAPAIAGDPRFAALKSTGERRACFTEYRAAAAKREAVAAREARGRARDAFTAALAGVAGLDAGVARFSDAERALAAHPAWAGLDAAVAAVVGGPGPASAAAARREKEAMFEEWRRGAGRAAREAARAAREAAVSAIAAWVERRGWVEGGTRWREAEDRLAAEAEADARGNPYAAADPAARLAGFSRAVRRAWEAEDEADAKAATDAARAERRARDAFRAVLGAHADAGLLPPRARWREYRARLRGGGFGGRVAGDGAGAAALEALEAPSASGPRPRDLFEDALAVVEARFRGQRVALLTAALQGAGLAVSRGVADGSAGNAAADLATLRLAFDDAADAAGGVAADCGGAVRDLVWAELVSKAAVGLVVQAEEEEEAEAEVREVRSRSRSPARADRRRRRSTPPRHHHDADRDRHRHHSRRRIEAADGDPEEGEL